MDKKFFGKLRSGEEIYTYTLKNSKCEATFMTRGAAIVSFKPYGTDIIGGFDNLNSYLKDTSHQGAIIGRVANRIKNARFKMDGKVYQVTKNENGNCLHGGDGFDRKIWNVCNICDDSITFSYTSSDGEDGFPAKLNVKVTYTLKDSTIIIHYEAIPDGKTPISLTNHSYFNLDGFGDKVYNQIAVIYSDKYTEVNENLIPTGTQCNVEKTVYDFNLPKRIGQNIGKDFLGYDTNYILNPKIFKEFEGKKLGLCAEVYSTKLKLEMYTDQPCLQFYTGNFLGEGPDFKEEIKQIPNGAFCLEAQTEPDCINHGIAFYDKGEVYSQTTVYKIDKM